MRVLLALLFPALLSGCIDADVTIAFTSETEVTTTGEMQMGRELFDMLGKSAETACHGGQGRLTDTGFTCTQTKTMTVEELLAQAPRTNQGTPDDLAAAANITRLQNGNIQVILDFSELMKGQQGAEELKGLAKMMKAAVAGHSFTFNISGPEIVSTTGTLSEDGLTATKIIPIATFLDAKPDFGPAFVTEVGLTGSCFLWVFC
jgi:hypothetical protein